MCRARPAVALQLGDGDVAVAWAGRRRRVAGPARTAQRRWPDDIALPPRRRALVPNCRVARETTIPAAILASTDGYGNSFEHDDWAPAVMRDLLDSAATALSTRSSLRCRSGRPSRPRLAETTRRSHSCSVPMFAPPRWRVPLTVTSRAAGGAACPCPPARWIEAGIVGVVALGVRGGVGFCSLAATGKRCFERTTQPLTVPVTCAPRRRRPATSAPIAAGDHAPPRRHRRHRPSTPSRRRHHPPPPGDVAAGVRATGGPGLRSCWRPVRGRWRSIRSPIRLRSGRSRRRKGRRRSVQILTTGGRWEAVESGLQFTPAEGSPDEAWPVEAPTRIAGLAFTGDRVVAVAVTPTDAGDVLEVGVFDGASGRQLLPISAQVSAETTESAGRERAAHGRAIGQDHMEWWRADVRARTRHRHRARRVIRRASR